jgi:formamidase
VTSPADIDVRIALQREIPLVDAPDEGHNRWHPDIPPIAEIEPGQVVQADLRDGFDVQLGADSTAESVTAMDMNRGHPLTGPFYVQGAEPGDVLEVELLDVTPDPVGTTCIIPGFGLLADEFAEPFLAVWKIEDGVARSEHIPGIAIRGEPFVGLLGVAPSAQQLNAFADREAALAARGGIVVGPDPVSAVPAGGDPALHGLRTIPPRENGGNMDVKQARIGARVLLEVAVPGALLSLGDIHFAQGDGESCGVAIEVGGVVTFRTALRKSGQLEWRPTFPAFEYHEEPKAERREYIAATGIPLDADGVNGQFDVYRAAANALRELISYLTATRGLTREQAYVLVSVAADLRISSIVNTPNAVVAAVLPLDIFDHGG